MANTGGGTGASVLAGVQGCVDAGFLLSAEYCETEEDAASKAKELLVRLRSNKAGVVDVTVTAFEALNAGIEGRQDDDGGVQIAVNMAAQLQLSAQEDKQREKASARGSRGSARSAKADKMKKAKQKKKKDKQSGTKKPSASEVAEAEASEVESELRLARIAAAKSRFELGAYKGALDAPSFTLPNPGGGTPLLEDSACRLVWGRRYGLIGRNGSGKSTMLRALAARRVGEIPPNVAVHYVSQEVNLTDEQRRKTPVECVVDADVERTLLEDERELLEARANSDEGLDEAGSRRHGDVLGRLDEIESSSASRRAAALLTNLGFSDAMQKRPLAELSGGWRVRTMLAAAIFAKPDLLLLDEPTNHLSILAVLWLARELATSDTWNERIVVIVSHDRHFMDEVCTDCLHISGVARRLTQCRGNYSKWAKARKEAQILFAKEQKARKDEIDRLREYAGHGFKYGGSASQINKMGMKAKQADKLEEVFDQHAEELAALREDAELPLKIASGGELDGYVVQLLGVGFGYPGATPRRLFEHAEFGVTSKTRIVLLGENGNGKTTLVKLLTGELEPTEGTVRRSPHARFALVNQHHADQIDLKLTPLQFLQVQFPGDGSYEHLQVLRGHLSSCGVTSGSSADTSVKDLQNTPASALSGGQRSRVALAAVSFGKPHVLILDEPTNNLDLESVAALAESVQSFEGAVICVSHDQFFVRAVSDEAWVVGGEDGRVTRVSSFDAYRDKQLRVLEKKKGGCR